MADCIYYCEIKDQVPEYPVGVYKVVASREYDRTWHVKLNRLMIISDRVWKQGPRGGVKIIRAPWSSFYPLGYITTNEKYMREFTWVKIRAKPIV